MFPEPVPEHDAIIASAFGDKTKSGKQIAEELNKIYGYMFVNHQPKTRSPSACSDEKRSFAAAGQRQ